MLQAARSIVVAGAVLAVLSCLPGVALASAPPSTPSGAAASAAVVVRPSDARPSVTISWQAATDSDGTVTGYVVQHAVGDGTAMVDLPAAAATSLVVGDLARGRVHRFAVVAVDDAGDRSAPTAELRVVVPVLAPSLALAQRVGAAGHASPCTTSGSRACERESLAGLRIELAAAPAASEAGRIAAVQLLHRTPGAARMLPAGTLSVPIGSDGSASIAVASTVIARGPGQWCVVATLPATDEQSAVTATRTCLRLRPPITIGWAGDTTLGSRDYGLPPHSGLHVFDAVLAWLRAPDLMIGNYEGTLSRGGTRRCSGGPLCFIFQAPPGNARALRNAGFDVMNLANNHGLDMGAGARAQTVRSLRAVDIGASGLPGTVTVRRVADTTVAIVGMTKYAGTTSMRSADVRAIVTRARRQADVVVVTMHAGLEGVGGMHVPRGDDDNAPTRTATHVAIDAGADVVFGSGPHVVRGVERYRGRYIVYSSGNFAGWHNFGLGGPTSQSGIVHMTFAVDGTPSGARWFGVRLSGPGIPVPAPSVVRRVAALSRADFGSRAARFAHDGSFH